MKTTVNLGIVHMGKLSYIAHLSNNEKRELFFRILWKDIKPSYFYDGLDNSERDIKNVDHVSFHENGIIHLIIKNNVGQAEERLYHRQLEKTIKEMPENDSGILLIYSIYDFSKFTAYIGEPSPRLYKDFYDVPIPPFDIEDSNKFSIVLFLLGKQVGAKEMLLSNFPSIFVPGNSICIEDYFVDEENNKLSDLKLLIAYTGKVLPPPEDKLLVSTEKLKHVDRIEPLMDFRLACQDKEIRQLV